MEELDILPGIVGRKGQGQGGLMLLVTKTKLMKSTCLLWQNLARVLLPTETVTVILGRTGTDAAQLQVVI